jgi:hypothetical protein
MEAEQVAHWKYEYSQTLYDELEHFLHKNPSHLLLQYKNMLLIVTPLLKLHPNSHSN